MQAESQVATLEMQAPRAANVSVGVVITGDNHLSAYLPRLTPQLRAERRARLRRGFEQAVQYALDHDARLFLQLGDLFDSPAPSNEDRAFVAECLVRLRRSGILAIGISGNHDTPRMRTEHGGESPQMVYAASGDLIYFSHAHVLRPRLVEIMGIRLAIAGLSNDPVSAPGSDPLANTEIDDPDGVLEKADAGILLLHAALEGLCYPGKGERIVTRASLAGLPAAFSVVAAGHVHRYAIERSPGRTLVVSGATERMEFGTASGSSGFVWMELAQGGYARLRRIEIEEQPRAEITISTAKLWPVADTSGDVAVSSNPDSLWWKPSSVEPPLNLLKLALSEVCTPETMVRLRLSGPLTLEQYHQLALRDILLYGHEHAFSFDLDTRGLRLVDPLAEGHTNVGGAGPVSPVHEIRRVLEERLEHAAHSDPDWADIQREAADVLTMRLSGQEDGEAGL